MHDLTVSEISEALKRRHARCSVVVELKHTVMSIERMGTPEEGPPAWIHVDRISGVDFEEVWNEFRSLYSDWFDENADEQD